MRAVQQAEAKAFWTLVGLGFLYGVFHAVGPGHGKVVISTYLATHESRLRRGIALSVLSSLLQGATAILAVGATVAVLQRSMREAHSAAIALETASYGLVAALGLYLALRSGRRLFGHARAHDHGPGQDAAVDAAAPCAHAHGPTAADLSAPPSLRHFVVTVLSVGLRPCSGAILVLVLPYLGLGFRSALVALTVLEHQLGSVQAEVRGLRQAYTNAVQMEARVKILEERRDLQFAALDSWKAIAELLPTDVTIEEISFGREKLTISGTVPAESELQVTEFNQNMRRASVDGRPLFSHVTTHTARTDPRGGTVTWRFECTLRGGAQ
jgi:Tfp pilus assembly protein PilN